MERETERETLPEAKHSPAPRNVPAKLKPGIRNTAANDLHGLPPAEEQRLLAVAKAGDRAALARIVEQYRPLILAAGHQRAVRTIADDATAAAAEELLRTVYAYDAARGVPFAAYAKPRVYGAVSHLLRSSSRTWQHETAPADMEELDRIPARDDEAAADARLTLAPLLAHLTADERRILALLYQQDLTTREAAKRLGCSQSKISRLKRQAIQKLKNAARVPY